jgi:hypothetical protein
MALTSCSAALVPLLFLAHVLSAERAVRDGRECTFSENRKDGPRPSFRAFPTILAASGKGDREARMRQERRGISRLAYGLLIVVLALLPLMAASCGGDDDKKKLTTSTTRSRGTTTTRPATSTTTQATTTTRR